MGENSCATSEEKRMARLIDKATVIAAAGNKPKRIEEFVGRVNSHTDQVSIARMQSSPGWEEPGQTPEFDEFTLVLAGMLRVETRTSLLEVRAGQAVHVPAAEWVRYSTPEAEGADYISVCLPAFSAQTVHRDV
jgi:mannose-6-phosphate isomerase-like protein (cupin superfamily)